MRSLVKYLGIMVGAVVLVGCALSDDPSSKTQGLQAAVTDQSVTGSFDRNGSTVRFESLRTGSGLYEVTVSLPDMTLIATMDELGGIDMDGFALDGGDTQMLSQDRVQLLALKNALVAKFGTAEDNAAAKYLVRFVSIWSEYPTTLELGKLVYAQEGRSYYSLCGYCGVYVQATHDCWDWDRGDDRSTYYGLVSMHTGGSCSDETYFWNGSSWVCYEPDHSSTVEYAYGDCFGRCGGGCGADSQMTWDCLDHDSCVRFGHDMASFWCDDEFTSTVDDWAAAPNCGSSCGI